MLNQKFSKDFGRSNCCIIKLLLWWFRRSSSGDIVYFANINFKRESDSVFTWKRKYNHKTYVTYLPNIFWYISILLVIFLFKSRRGSLTAGRHLWSFWPSLTYRRFNLIFNFKNRHVCPLKTQYAKQVKQVSMFTSDI